MQMEAIKDLKEQLEKCKQTGENRVTRCQQTLLQGETGPESGVAEGPVSRKAENFSTGLMTDNRAGVSNVRNK